MEMKNKVFVVPTLIGISVIAVFLYKKLFTIVAINMKTPKEMGKGKDDFYV
jgi:hypothetical protein